jgi:hypothetical protein
MAIFDKTIYKSITWLSMVNAKIAIVGQILGLDRRRDRADLRWRRCIDHIAI